MTDVASRPTEPEPIADWATDFDILDPGYIEDPVPVWNDLQQRCPIAHTDRHGGSWLPTKYDDLVALAHDTDRFTSRNVGVIPPPPGPVVLRVPPIDSDPPEHRKARRLILPAFSPQRVQVRDEPFVLSLADQLIDGFIDDGHVDAAVDYAQQIPPRAIAHMLGIPDEMCDDFISWVRGVLELGYADPELRDRSRDAIINYFIGLVEERAADPSGDDLISEMLRMEVDGEPITPREVMNTCNLLLIAGIDTTWSSIGSAMLHLATHDDDRRRLVTEPELIPTAVEELLRVYSPVTMARIVAEDTTYNGCEFAEGDRIIMAFPAGNHDPDHFPDADDVIIDRAENRHMAFGIGIHRCAGSNLARLEMQIAVQAFLARIPEFRLAPDAEVTWAGGQVRGPRHLPLVFS